MKFDYSIQLLPTKSITLVLSEFNSEAQFAECQMLLEELFGVEQKNVPE